MPTAVNTIFVRKDRQYNRRFLQMCSHHLVDIVMAVAWYNVVVRIVKPMRIETESGSRMPERDRRCRRYPASTVLPSE